MYLYMIGAFTPKKIAFIKVGVAKDVQARIRQLQTGQAFEIRLLRAWTAKGRAHAFDMEARVHRQFGKFRVRGEWYRNHMIRKLEAYIRNIMDSDPSLVGDNSRLTRESEKSVPEHALNDLRVMAWLRQNGLNEAA